MPQRKIIIGNWTGTGYIVMNDDGTAAYMISGGLNGGHKKLSKYDRYVIAIAGEVNILAVSNDKPVRELCNSYDIKITETLGVVCSAYENDLISFKVMVEGLEFLFSEESTCYLSNSLKRKIFKYYSI